MKLMYEIKYRGKFYSSKGDLCQSLGFFTI